MRGAPAKLDSTFTVNSASGGDCEKKGDRGEGLGFLHLILVYHLHRKVQGLKHKKFQFFTEK